MKNKELITELSNRMQMEPAQVQKLLTCLGEIIGSRLVDNDSVNLQGLGQFEAKKKGERVSVNPSSGRRYLVPPKLVPVFKPGTTVKGKLKDLSHNE